MYIMYNTVSHTEKCVHKRTKPYHKHEIDFISESPFKGITVLVENISTSSFFNQDILDQCIDRGSHDWNKSLLPEDKTSFRQDGKLIKHLEIKNRNAV